MDLTNRLAVFAAVRVIIAARRVGKTKFFASILDGDEDPATIAAEVVGEDGRIPSHEALRNVSTDEELADAIVAANTPSVVEGPAPLATDVPASVTTPDWEDPTFLDERITPRAAQNAQFERQLLGEFRAAKEAEKQGVRVPLLEELRAFQEQSVTSAPAEATVLPAPQDTGGISRDAALAGLEEGPSA